MAASAEGKDILIPMTTSLYVPGKMAETEKVIVDVGTGYFVEKVGILKILLLYILNERYQNVQI